MRGDRPTGEILFPVATAATPHARGSTFYMVTIKADSSGYPACAGIDLTPGMYTMTDPRLPRMRGDRPWWEIVSPTHTTATPHARGSTQFCSAYKKGQEGYPACAGIDLAAGLLQGGPARLPRMRGDRPV